jgi:hypothetical protein
MGRAGHSTGPSQAGFGPVSLFLFIIPFSFLFRQKMFYSFKIHSKLCIAPKILKIFVGVPSDVLYLGKIQNAKF